MVERSGKNELQDLRINRFCDVSVQMFVYWNNHPAFTNEEVPDFVILSCVPRRFVKMSHWNPIAALLIRTFVAGRNVKGDLTSN